MTGAESSGQIAAAAGAGSRAPAGTDVSREVPAAAFPARKEGGNSMRYAALTEDQRDYLERLKDYKAHGVGIYIDGIKRPERDWEKIFMLADRARDGSLQFYVSDYVFGENGEIREIHLDKVQIKNL